MFQFFFFFNSRALSGYSMCVRACVNVQAYPKVPMALDRNVYQAPGSGPRCVGGARGTTGECAHSQAGGWLPAGAHQERGLCCIGLFSPAAPGRRLAHGDRTTTPCSQDRMTAPPPVPTPVTFQGSISESGLAMRQLPVAHTGEGSRPLGPGLGRGTVDPTYFFDGKRPCFYQQSQPARE